MANAVPPVPYKSPLTDSTGRLTQAWSAWFRELFNRIGGNTASANSDLDDDVDDLQQQINDLKQGRSL